jgi:hypothetical protein
VEVSSVGIVVSVLAIHEGIRNSTVMVARYSDTQHCVSAKGYKEQPLSPKKISFSIYRTEGCLDPIKYLDTLEKRDVLHLPEIEP